MYFDANIRKINIYPYAEIKKVTYNIKIIVLKFVHCIYLYYICDVERNIKRYINYDNNDTHRDVKVGRQGCYLHYQPER